MDRAALAQDFADEIDALAETVAQAVIEELRPLIERAWRRAFSPPVTVLASVDEGALGTITADWVPPPKALDAIETALHTGADTGMMSLGIGSGPSALPLDAAAQQYMSEATNRLVGVGSSAWQEARQVLSESLASNLTREQVKGKLEDVLNASEYRADTIARTETQAAANAGVNISGRIMSEAGADVRKEWFTQIDGRTRPEHELADGQQVGVNEQFTVGGELLDFPGDPNGSPGNTINCRCTMLMIQGEMDIPEPEAPPWSADEWTGAPFDLTPMTQQSVSRDGIDYTFTPGDRARADASAAINEVYRRAGLSEGSVFRYQDAYQGGSLWESPGPLSQRRAAWPVSGELDPAKLIAEDVAKLQRQQVVDWLFGQQSAATSEFERYGLAANKAPLYRADPARAALKSVAEDNFAKLAPEKLTGVYADISRGYVEGTTSDFVNISASNAKAKDLQAFVKGIQDIPDDEFRRMLRAIAHERSDAEAYIEAMIERKNGLLKDFQTYHNRLYAQRQKFAKGGKAANEVKAEIKAFTPPAGHGGPTGFKVEVQEYGDRRVAAERAKEWDSPIFHGDPAFDEAYRYTGSGYASINTGRRQGTRTARKLEARMGEIKKEVTVHRATNLRLDLPHEQMAGKVFHDNAFLSTSIGGTPAFSGDTVLRIKLNPTSAKGVYVDHMSAHPGEKEFILQPGQRLYVHKVHVRGKPEPGADANLVQVFTQRPSAKYVLDVETVTEQWARDHMGYP